MNSRALVGIDIGKSSFKYYTKTAEGKPVIGEIPSLFARGVLHQIVSDPSSPPSCISYNGSDYIIGVDATLGENFSWKKDEEKGDERGLVFILGVLARLGFREADIMVGLPVSSFTNKKIVQAVKTMFSGIKQCTINGKTTLFDIKTNIIEEPLGTYFYLVLDDNIRLSRDSQYYKEEMAIVDIGHRTLDIVTVRSGKLSTAKDSTMSGAVTMFDKAEKWLESKYGKLRPNEKVRVHETIVNNFGSNSLRIGGEPVSPEFWQVVTSLKEQLAKDIIDDTKSILSSIRPDMIMMTGGGANLLRAQLVRINNNLRFADDPKFANAIGFYRAAVVERLKQERAAANQSAAHAAIQSAAGAQ